MHLESIEAAERIYLEAMPDAGEMRVWREGIHSEALLGVGRAEDALAIADSAVETARRYRLLWSLPLALKAQAKARAAAGQGGVAEALDEALEITRSTGCLMSAATIEDEREALAAAG